MNERDALDLCADLVARARAAGADEAEAYLEASTTTTVDANGGALEAVTSATARGVGLRALVGGSLGFSSGADLDPAGRADLAEQAVRLARVGTPDPARGLPDPAAQPSAAPAAALAIHDPAALDLTVEAMAALLARAEQAARTADRRVESTHLARASRVVERVAIVTSRGIAASFEATGCALSLSVIARENGDAQRGYASQVARGPGALDPDAIGYRAARRAATTLGGTPLTTRRASVVFEPDVIAELLRGLAQALSGDAVTRGRSLFAARPGGAPWLGSRIGSAAVHLVDDGRLPGAPATAPVDGEGVPTRTSVLVEGGYLRGLLYNAEAARRTGTASTGNGTRPSYRSLPEVGQTNLVLRPGTRAPAALVASVEEGLYVVATRNVGGINPVSGDYSVGASGRRIVRGELAEPVTGVTLAAPMLELLRNVREVGSDLRWVSGQGGYVGAPTVLVDDLTIGGR